MTFKCFDKQAYCSLTSSEDKNPERKLSLALRLKGFWPQQIFIQRSKYKSMMLRLQTLAIKPIKFGC